MKTQLLEPKTLTLSPRFPSLPHSPDDFQDALLGLAGMLPLLEHGEHLLLAVDADGRQDRVELEEIRFELVDVLVLLDEDAQVLLHEEPRLTNELRQH